MRNLDNDYHHDNDDNDDDDDDDDINHLEESPWVLCT